MAKKDHGLNWQNKVNNTAQIGGIETSVLDNGPGKGTRIAWVNTGTGLRYKVVIDRGLDIVDAFYNLAYGFGVGEAVYVNTLIMNAGATIDPNGLNLYYLNGGGPKQFFCGDATLDGYIDGNDLDILLADWGTGVPPANHRADLSGDFFVDGDDLDLILSDWGKGVPPPVPEPATLLLLTFGGLAVIRRRR